MSRKLTSLNPLHPHTRLLSFKQNMKAQYRQLSTSALDTMVNAAFAAMTDEEAEKTEHPQHRHEKMEFLLVRAGVMFKAEWAKKYGWEFDLCYDNAKLKEAVRAMTDPVLKAEFPLREEGPVQVPSALPVPNPIDLTRIHTPDGGTMLRADYDKLPKEEKKPIWEHMNTIITALVQNGLAGMLGEKDGVIVDRRLYPQALLATFKSAGPAAKIEHECPDGMEMKETAFSLWLPYRLDQYLKTWARVRLKDGTYDLAWRWPNAGFFGPHAEADVLEVQYCADKDDKDTVKEILDYANSVAAPTPAQ